MAATRLIVLHAGKRRSVARSLNDRTDYAKNPEKTEKVKKAAAAKVTKAKKDIEAKADDVKAAVKKASTTKKADPKVDV